MYDFAKHLREHQQQKIDDYCSESVEEETLTLEEINEQIKYVNAIRESFFED